jgi:hypothetical protein
VTKYESEYYRKIACRHPVPAQLYIVPDMTLVECGSLPSYEDGYDHAQAALADAGFVYQISCDAWFRA